MPLGIQQDVTLETLLNTFAHTMPVRILAFVAGAATLLLMVVWVWQPTGTWPLTAIGVCGASFAMWAIANRQLESDTSVSVDRSARATRLSLRVARRVSAITGVLSGAVLVMSVPMALLGTWIS